MKIIHGLLQTIFLQLQLKVFSTSQLCDCFTDAHVSTAVSFQGWRDLTPHTGLAEFHWSPLGGSHAQAEPHA